MVLMEGHVVVVGEPRAGRSDLVAALRSVLDPKSTLGRVNPLDIHRPLPDQHDAPMTEVEVALLDLGEDLEELLAAHLEAFDRVTAEAAGSGVAETAVLGVRLCYRARYDFDSDTGEHWVDWPAQSDPASGVFARARRVEREALPFHLVQPGPALQVRAEGVFRGLVEDAEPDELLEALKTLEEGVRGATEEFSSADAVSAGLSRVVAAGTGDLLGLTSASKVGFVPDDGSLAALLRALQPAIDLDAAGFVPLRSHGSTAAGVLSASEAVAAAAAYPSGLVVVVDDFGENLDASSAEYLAILLRRNASQVVVTTRRPEVVRAFELHELLRLTRSHGLRQQHRLEKATDRKSRKARRDLLDQLTSAMTGSTVVLMEGPHDIEAYGAVSARWARRSKDTSRVLAAHGVRLACAPGEHGGKDSLPALATLAGRLGFHVRAVVDDDKPGESDALFDTLESLTEQLVVLPQRTAVEGALVRGLAPDVLRAALQVLVEDYELDVKLDDLPDEQIADTIVKKKLLKQKGGLHKPWVEALPHRQLPELALDVLKIICSDEMGRIVLEAPA